MTTLENLRPCPFCDRHNLKIKTKNKDGRILYAVRCEDCGLHGPVSGEELIAKISWNMLPSIGEADWLAAHMKCDNAFTPEQEAACIRENGPCVRCLREAAQRNVMEDQL